MIEHPIRVLATASMVIAVFAAGSSRAAERLDGSRDIYLSLADASRESHGWGTPRDGATVTEAPLRIGAISFERGIGTHAPAELVFPLAGRYRWLTFYAGISAEMTDSGSVTVQVWLDGRKVHETPVLRVHEEPVYVSLPVNEARELHLVGTDAGNGVGADHLCLGNLRLGVGAEPPAPDGPKPAPPLVIEPLAELAGHMPERGAASTEPAKRWEYGMVTGNGRMGAVALGHPTRETIITNHCRLFLPLGNREIVPDLAQYVPELRRIIRERGYDQAMDFFLGKAREQGYPGLIPTDPFHPGLFIEVRQGADGPVTDYIRTEDFETGEVVTRWRDQRGEFRRRLFVSRPENVLVISVAGPSPCELRFPPVGHELIESWRQLSPQWATFHNVYVKGKGGFDVAVRIVPRGGRAEVAGDVVTVTGADEVLLLVRIVPWKTPLARDHSEAWAYSPEHPDFQRPGVFDPAPALGASSVVAYRDRAAAEALMPQLQESLARLQADYERLFAPHARTHSELFRRVTLDLGGGANRARTTEELLDIAQREKRLPPAILEKMYDAGRYMLLCSAGERPPNLQGIWSGSWTPAWSGDYTLDTNVQAAMASACSADLPELMEGYFQMIEEFYPEWRLNARRIYGCRGFFSNARASNTCLLLHWGGWEGVFWTAGSGWLASFFIDYAQYTGDREFLARRCVPLLKEIAAFYEDFLSEADPDGRVVFIPSYNPETDCGTNVTMDIAVAREVLSRLIAACRELNVEADSIPRWEALLARLPEYPVNAQHQLAEWPGGGVSERHRHHSQLYPCFQSFDPLFENVPELRAAAQATLRAKVAGSDQGGEQSSFGRVQAGVSAAYLGMAEEAYGRLQVMAVKRSMYPSLITSHEPNGGILNTDGNGGIPHIVNTMLCFSRPERLDLLPALPAAWAEGSIRGLPTRCGCVVDMTWSGGRLASATLRARRDASCTVRYNGSSVPVCLGKGETLVLDSQLGAPAR